MLVACGSQDEPPPPKPVAWIKIGTGSNTDIATNVPGRVQARNRTVLSFEVGGTIASAGPAFRPFTDQEVAGYRAGAKALSAADVAKLHEVAGGK